MPKIFHRERANGCVKEIQDFLDYWEAHGPFPLTIDRTGGLRTDEALQEELFRTHASKARTLKDTPHGRGAAVDMWPAVLNESGSRVVAIQMTRKKLTQMGEVAEQKGLVWGGRFTGFFDGAHIETKNWRALPFPPDFKN